MIQKNNSNIKCMYCGCDDFISAKTKGIYGKIYPIKSISYLGGTHIIYDICSSCGSIVRSRVDNIGKIKVI